MATCGISTRWTGRPTSPTACRCSAVSIGYADEQGVRLGVVYDPTRDEMFTAERGQGAWLNGARLQVSAADELLQCLLTTGFAYDNWVIETNLEHFSQLPAPHARACAGWAQPPSTCATWPAGRVDGYWEVQVQPWDLAAGGLIAAEAGARVTNLQGGADYLTPPCCVLAANPALHAKMSDEVNKSPR